MKNDYAQAIAQAKANLVDARTRGEEALGDDWDELARKYFTPEEIAEAEAKAKATAALMFGQTTNRHIA